MAPTRGATNPRLRDPSSNPIQAGDAVVKVLIESLTSAQLRHLAAAMEAREYLPGWLAMELANELAKIVSTPPMETEYGLIYNRPTIGWWSRRANRIAQARSSS
jgi:hypothetical protein